MKRGEIWTIAGGADYAIIIQGNKFNTFQSITICPLTGTPVDAAPARFVIAPSAKNGLQISSHVMVDKIATIPKSKAGRRIGELDSDDVQLLNQHVAVFLGLAE